MKHINTIETLYKKYINKTLITEELDSYKIQFERKDTLVKETRLKDAKFASLLHFKIENKVCLSSKLIEILEEHMIFLDSSIDIMLPLLYITLDGGFVNRLQDILDTAFYDSKYTQLIDNSYFIKIERSDVMLFLRIFHTRRNAFPECLDYFSKRIRSGSLLVSEHSSEIESRTLFWNYLNLYDLRIVYINVTNIQLPKLGEWEYYIEYLKEKKGYYPDGDELHEIILNNNNKWIYHILNTLFGGQEKFYIGEDLEDVNKFYISLGLNKTRNFLGVGLFDFTEKHQLGDIILDRRYWKNLELIQYSESLYATVYNLNNTCFHYYQLLLREIFGVLKNKSKGLDILDLIIRIYCINIITDVTLDLREAYRHPVTYDFFTTIRIIPIDSIPIKQEFIKPLLDLTEDVRIEIKKISQCFKIKLTEYECEDDFHNYKKFYIQYYQTQLLHNLNDSINIADNSGDYDKAQKLISEKFNYTKYELEKKIQETLEKYRKEKPWEKRGIRKHLKLKPNESFR